MNMLSRTQIHQRIRPPKRTPLQLLHLLLDRGRNGRIPNIGVDLDLEHASDDLRFQFQMPFVRNDDGPSSRHLGPYKLGIHALAMRDVGHFFGDDAPPREMHLGVSIEFALAVLNPFGSDFGQA